MTIVIIDHSHEIMNITGTVHCFFEQSGTFKNEFIKLGFHAEDYDIQNNFGETDHVIDLFQEIEHAYDGKLSVFDYITQDDLIIAFFPCIYFCDASQLTFSFGCVNYRKLNIMEKTQKIIERSYMREKFFGLAVKLFAVVINKGLRLIMENPWTGQTFLKANFVQKPSFVDWNRMRRGDYFIKPTAYWFVNCEPTSGKSYQMDKERKTILRSKAAHKSGICSESRSMISPDYARNFICDFVIGKAKEVYEQKILFPVN